MLLALVNLPRLSTQMKLLLWVFPSSFTYAGAIFRGAQLNNQFRVKDMRPKDYSTYPVIITSTATLNDSKDISHTLFPIRTKLGNSKTLAFKTDNDFSFTVSYAPDFTLPSDIATDLIQADITGVAEKIEKLKGTNECHDPSVKVTFKLTDAGIVEIAHGEVQCEIREKKNLADKFMGLFGGKDKETPEEQIIFEAAKTSPASAADTAATEVSGAEKVRFEKAALRVSTTDLSRTVMTADEKIAAKKSYGLCAKVNVVSRQWINSITPALHGKKLSTPSKHTSTAPETSSKTHSSRK
jgi:hypothetical protein